MKTQTITAHWLNTICWFNNTIIDWGSAGKQFFLDGRVKQHYKYSYTLPNAAAACSEDGQYSFIYTMLGTKGLLLKGDKLLREINRSYYCAGSYLYPATFVTVDGITYLIHCPVSYDQLDFENVETGELITNIPGRDPSDFFHSRLEISPNGKYLMSRGWFWHPLDQVQLFNIKDCLANPNLLDRSTMYPDGKTEVCTASFISDTKVLIGTSDEVLDDEYENNIPIKSVAIWDVETGIIANPVKVNGEFGNLFAINDTYAWDMFKFPKIINIQTGEIVDKFEGIESGKQNSAIVSEPKQIIYNTETKQIAIKGKDQIEVLTPEF